MTTKHNIRIEDADEHHAFITLDGQDVAVIRPLTRDPVHMGGPHVRKLTPAEWQKILDYLSGVCNS